MQSGTYLWTFRRNILPSCRLLTTEPSKPPETPVQISRGRKNRKSQTEFEFECKETRHYMNSGLTGVICKNARVSRRLEVRDGAGKRSFSWKILGLKLCLNCLQTGGTCLGEDWRMTGHFTNSLGRDTARFCKWVTFRRNVLLSSSAGLSNPRPEGRMRPRTATNVAQQKNHILTNFMRLRLKIPLIILQIQL
jgi:hypothetical protein